MNRTHRRVKGYTLVEVVLVVALFATVASMFVVLDQNFISRNDLDISSETVTESLRRARILSMASSGNETWGVHLTDDSATVFRGASFAERDPEYDEVYYIPASVSVSGISDVIFGKVYGEPSAEGEVVLSSDINSSIVVSINEIGIVHH